MILTRRTFSKALTLASMTAMTAAAIGVSPWTFLTQAHAQSPEAIAKPSTLGDMALGAKDAPVTIVEYASMTCPHCAVFTQEVFPKLKEAYIDTGKVRYIFREFPLDQAALAASATARCIAKDDSEKYFALIDIFFKQQNDLATDPFATIVRVAKQAGFTEPMIKSCIQDDPKVQKGILDDRQYASETLKVNATPSFFINGTLVKGETSFENLKKMIDPMLKS